MPILRFDLEGDVLDTAYHETLDFDAEAKGWTEVRGVTIGAVELPTSWPWAVGLGPDSLFVERAHVTEASRGLVRVTRKSAEGDTVWSRVLASDPIPVSPSYRDSVLDAAAETYERRFGSRAAARSAVEEAYAFLPHHPAVSRLSVRRTPPDIVLSRNGATNHRSLHREFPARSPAHPPGADSAPHP